MEAIRWTFSVSLLICLSSIQVRPIIYAYGAFIEHHLSSFHNDVSFYKLPGCVMSTDNVTLNVSCSHFKIRQYSKLIPPETYSLNITGGNYLIFNQKFFSHLNNLKALHISNNMIRFITPKVFTNLSNLQELNLANNKIRVLHSRTFENSPLITTLDLSGNLIRLVPYVVQSTSVLRRLVRLDLSNNQRLTYIYLQDFSSIQNSTLRELGLRNCSLKTIEKGAFVPLANLQILDLRQNSLPYTAVKNATTGLNNNNLKTLKF